MKFTPASAAAATMRVASVTSVRAPNIIVPKHSADTVKPLSPSLRYSMEGSSALRDCGPSCRIGRVRAQGGLELWTTGPCAVSCRRSMRTCEDFDMPSALPDQMHAVEISRPGGPEVLRVVSRALPQPKSGEVLIRVAAAGVNRPDCMQRAGTYAPPPGASDLPGLEVSGTVVA